MSSENNITPAYKGPNYWDPATSGAHASGGKSSPGDDANMQAAIYLAYLAGGRGSGDVDQMNQALDWLRKHLDSLTDPTIKGAAEKVTSAVSGTPSHFTDAQMKTFQDVYAKSGYEMYQWVKGKEDTMTSPDAFFKLVLFLTETSSASWVADHQDVQGDLTEFFGQQGSPNGVQFASQFLAAYIRVHPEAKSLVKNVLDGDQLSPEQTQLSECFNGKGAYSLSGWQPPAGISAEGALSAIMKEAVYYLPGSPYASHSSIPLPSAPATQADVNAYKALKSLLAKLKEMKKLLANLDSESKIKKFEKDYDATKKNWESVIHYLSKSPAGEWDPKYAQRFSHFLHLDTYTNSRVSSAIEVVSELLEKLQQKVDPGAG